MATERLAPIAITQSYNVINEDVTYIDEDTQAPDGLSIVPNDSTRNMELTVLFPMASAEMTGSQTVAWYQHTSDFSSSNIEIYQYGVLVAKSQLGLSGDGRAVFSFDASQLSDPVHPESIEAKLICISGIDGIDAIELNANIIDAPNNYSPNIPVLVSPSSGELITTWTIGLSATVSDPDGGRLYAEFEYTTDPNFVNNITTVMSGIQDSGLNAITTTDVTSNGTYYWRARAYDGAYYSDYTAIDSFIVDDKPPNIPVVISPDNNAIVTSSDVTFSFNTTDPEGDLSYVDIIMSSSKDFSNATIYSTIGSSSGSDDTIMISLGAGNWYWKARARTVNGQSSGYTSPRGLYVDIPITSILNPITIESMTNLSGTVSDISSSDSSYLTSQSNADTSVIVSFQSPPNILVGSQEFKVTTKESDSSASVDLTHYIRLLDNGTQKAEYQGLTIKGAGDTETSLTWDASLSSDPSGTYITCQVYGVASTVRKNGLSEVDVNYIQWIASYNPPMQDPLVNADPPYVYIDSIDKTTISNKTGKDRAVVTFYFDADVDEYIVRVLGVSNDTGILAHSGGSATAGTLLQAEIDYTELSGEGDNRVNIYGRNSGGWTPYEG